MVFLLIQFQFQFMTCHHIYYPYSFKRIFEDHMHYKLGFFFHRFIIRVHPFQSSFYESGLEDVCQQKSESKSMTDLWEKFSGLIYNLQRYNKIDFVGPKTPDVSP